MKTNQIDELEYTDSAIEGLLFELQEALSEMDDVAIGYYNLHTSVEALKEHGTSVGMEALISSEFVAAFGKYDSDDLEGTLLHAEAGLESILSTVRAKWARVVRILLELFDNMFLLSQRYDWLITRSSKKIEKKVGILKERAQYRWKDGNKVITGKDFEFRNHYVYKEALKFAEDLYESATKAFAQADRNFRVDLSKKGARLKRGNIVKVMRADALREIKVFLDKEDPKKWEQWKSGGLKAIEEWLLSKRKARKLRQLMYLDVPATKDRGLFVLDITKALRMSSQIFFIHAANSKSYMKTATTILKNVDVYSK